MKKNEWDDFAWNEVFDALNDIIYITKPDYSIVKLNNKARSFLGIEEDMIPTGKCHQVVFNKQHPCEFCLRNEVLSCKKCPSIEKSIHVNDRILKIKTSQFPRGSEAPVFFINQLQDITSEIKTIRHLEETEEKYKLIAENSSDVILLINSELQFTFASPSVKTLTGYSPEEFIKIQMDEVLTPDSYKKVRALYATNKMLGRVTGNYQVIKKDKTIVWAEMAITPIRDNLGEITGYISQSRDVSDKKKALDELKISEERYNLVQENAEIRISYFSADGRVVFMNRTSAMYFGGTPEEFTGKHYSEFVNTTDIEKYNQRFKEILQSAAAIDYEDENLFNSKKLHILTTLSRTTDNEGNTKGILVIIKDITELKKAEEKIKQNEERLKSMLQISQMDNTHQSEILEHSLNEALRFTQSKIGFIYHYNEQQMTFSLNNWSKSDEEACSLPHPVKHRQLGASGLWANSIRERKAIIVNDYQNEHSSQNLLPPGHPKVIRYLSVPVFWDNQIVALVGVANKEDAYTDNDIHHVQLLMNTVWKIIERKKAESNLLLALEKAEESDRLKSAFLSNLSHEIRTPVNGVMGFLNLIKDNDYDEETINEYVDIIDSNFNHLITLISDIVDLSKLESNQMKLIKSNFNIKELIEEIYQQNLIENVDLKNKGIRPSYNLPEDDTINPFINADKSRLRQVLISLINNAVKFTSKGEVSIGYTLEGGFIRFFVYDTGIGIKPDQLDIIFEHFRQAEDSLTRRFGGIGLGLSISKRLVHLMGGEIWAESEINQYSKFFFTIPYIPIEENTLLTTPVPKSSCPNWKGRTILIIEDDNATFLYLREVLKRTEASIIRTSSCKGTQQLLKQEYNIDLVLLDIRLPDGMGIDLIPQIREQYKEIPIIAQTAFAFETEIQEYLKSGCNDCLPKPINEDTLLRTMNVYLRINAIS